MPFPSSLARQPTTFEPLSPGATIGVIAPAGPARAEDVERIAPWLETHGYRARVFPGCRENTGFLAGADDVRLADLHAAFADDTVDAILCMRGGYGSARLLDRIDFGVVGSHAKPFAGYSDITSLHIAFNQQLALPTIHAPMVTSDLLKEGGRTSADALFALLESGLPRGSELAGGAPLHTLHGGRAEGRITGGNLSVISAGLGTRWAIDAHDCILFLEEVGEAPYRIDRMFNQLRLAGVLDAAAGFVLGSFSDADDPSAVIEEFLAPLGKPVLAGWPAGHCAPNYPVPLGVEVLLDADAQRIAIL